MRKLIQADQLLAQGQDVADMCRELRVTKATHYRWRNQFGGLKADDAKRLKDLERENSVRQVRTVMVGGGVQIGAFNLPLVSSTALNGGEQA